MSCPIRHFAFCASEELIRFESAVSSLVCLTPLICRVDQLSLMLMMGNLRAGSKCLVFEQCSGMLSAAVIDRLGGHGVCVHLHRGNSVQSIPCIESMDFDEKVFIASET